MCKKIAVYLMVFYISFFPVQRANAVVPIIAGAVYAIELAAPHAIRFLASEIAISAVVKAVQASNAYYSANAKISNLKYLKYFKTKAALGVAAFIGIIDALGYYMANDGVVMKESSIDIPIGDVAPVAGYAWCHGNTCGSTVTEAAWSYVASLDYITSIKINPYYFDEVSQDHRDVDFLMSGDRKWAGSGKTFDLRPCQYVRGVVESCQEGYTPPNGQSVIVNDAVLSSSLLSHISTLDKDKQKELLADSFGVLDADLARDFEAENAPLMPDEKTPIPDIGDQSWKNAHLIASAKAQSSDSSKPNYVSTADWDEAYYLANVVANGNDYITGLNSGEISVTKPGDKTGGEAGTGTGDVSVTVDVAGVESRLDTTNQLSESILNEVKSINSSTVDLQQMPDESKAKSFWPKRYPDGLSGVLSKFIENMKQTPIFKWLDQFVLNIGSGTAPVYEFCFGTIANIDFGCLELKADSYVWVGIRSALIISALLMARRLVFGG
ncbi:hypothetical protein [Photobacterium sanguinicancri]|uniref:hypothetical protein n=1 Tax=Photobacterium sanguinicancri TaxID=875932 RepID=UPI0026E30027|nr:hypothetical protein [Photobacterium sanguinicancri]MDO6499245.1 hypothetical protein [Photobacterium sanguinicancri]MDO6499253.1 hypothetical protein [Photobacterium sanguinicancri]